MLSERGDKITAAQTWPGEGKVEVSPGSDTKPHVTGASTQAKCPKAAQRTWEPVWWKLF